MRLIDADALIAKWEDEVKHIEVFDHRGMVYGAINDVKRQPTIEVPRWIPVSSGHPEAGIEVWVTIKGHDVITVEEGETLEQALERIGKIRWVTRAYWSEEEHGWNDPEFGCPLIVKPIAWMPMNQPEPWEGGAENE